MSYQVLARKWRPQNFSELVGQEHVKTALTHALSQNRLHHAYLFTGTRGVGKTTIARIFAKSLNCEQGVTATPCGICSACTEIDQGFFVDLLEIDAASRTKVEDTRDLLDNVQYAPSRGRYKVYLIDEVHMLSRHSFNALLKTLEEPPPHVKFLLATTDPQKLPITVLSRCLQFSLKALSQQQIKQHLSYVLSQEQVTAEDDALALLARAAKGSLRDSLSLTDQAIAQTNGDIQLSAVREMLGYLEQSWAELLLQDVLNRDLAGMQQHMQQLVSSHSHFQGVLDDMLSLLHLVALSQFQLSASELALTESAFVRATAKHLSAESVQLYYQLLLSGKKDLPFAPEPRIGLEMALLRAIAFVPQKSSATEPSSPRTAALNAAQIHAPVQGSLPSPGNLPSPQSAAAQAATFQTALPQTASSQTAPIQAAQLAQPQSNLAAAPTADVVSAPTPAPIAPVDAVLPAAPASVAPTAAAVDASTSLTASILARRLGGGAAKKSEAAPVIAASTGAAATSRQVTHQALPAAKPAFQQPTSQVPAQSAADYPPWETPPTPAAIPTVASTKAAPHALQQQAAALPLEPASVAPQLMVPQPVQQPLAHALVSAEQQTAVDPVSAQYVAGEPALGDVGHDDPVIQDDDDCLEGTDWQWQATLSEPVASQPIRHVLLDSLTVAAAVSTDFASEQIEEVVPVQVPDQPLVFDGQINAANFALRSAAQVDSWANRIDSLRIGGLMRLFLLSSSAQIQGDTLLLTVAHSQRHLDSERNRQQLSQVLSESFGQQLTVEIVFAEQVSDSPQMIQQRIDMARRQYVQSVLAEDPALSALTEDFQAQWLPDTLEVF